MTSFQLLSCYPPVGLQNIYNPQSIFSSGHFMPYGDYGYLPRYVSCSPCVNYIPIRVEDLGTKFNDPCGYSYLPGYSSSFQRPGKYRGLFSYGRSFYEPRGYSYLSSNGRTCYDPYGYRCTPSSNLGCCYSSHPWGYSVSSCQGSCYEPRGYSYLSSYGRCGYEPYGYNCAPSYTCGNRYSSKTCGYSLSGYGGCSKKPRSYGYSSSTGRNSYDCSSHKGQYPYRRHSSSQLEPPSGDYYSGSSHGSDYRRRSSRCSSTEEHA